MSTYHGRTVTLVDTYGYPPEHEQEKLIRYADGTYDRVKGYLVT